MARLEKYLTFLCSGAAKTGNKKLSYRIAAHLESLGIADIGNLENLSAQHSKPIESQRKMIFINDCRSGCVNVLTHGLANENYVFLDVSAYLHSLEFDIEKYITSELLPKINEKWSYSLSRETDCENNK